MHKPVLLPEVIQALSPQPNGFYIDGTLGGGGHAEAVLEASAPNGHLLGFDQDPEAIVRCQARLARFGSRFQAIHGDFASQLALATPPLIPSNGVDGILLDLGVSSFQIDDPQRGFSFLHEGPLDMRMNLNQSLTARTLLDSFQGDWHPLAKILQDYGEEPNAHRIARAILLAHTQSPLTTTTQLAQVVEKAVGGRRGAPKHPATRTFQALRIAVNLELEQVQKGLENALLKLRESGTLAVITFHSLEDRLTKQIFAAHEGRHVSLQQGGSQWEGSLPAVQRVYRKPLTPALSEISDNPRARSAKLRVVRRIPSPL